MKFLKDIRMIQGGMGVYISNWKLARAASMSKLGSIAGTLSGTAMDYIYTRKLQLGDPGSHVHDAFTALDKMFGCEIGKKTYDKYYIKNGKQPSERFKNPPKAVVKTLDGSTSVPMPATQGETIKLKLDEELVELMIAVGFAEVYLAKKNNNGVIFINFLNKIDLPLIFTMYGAILAGVDGIVVGAGNPDGLPKVVSMLANHEEVSIEPAVLYKEPSEKFVLPFNPKSIANGALAKNRLKKPAFLAIVSLEDLAVALANSTSMPPDGLIIENHTAGGHNANPVGPMKKDELGQPIYSEKDVANIEAIKNTGLPFWLGGGYDSKEKLDSAMKQGAAGVQTGTIYALAEESGMTSEHRSAVFNRIKNGADDLSIVRTTMYSPTGFSFKVAMLDGTLSDNKIYENRKRICDMGLLQQVGVDKPDANGLRRLFHRCPAAPVDSFVNNRGLQRNSEEKRCLCNGLTAGAGYPQTLKSADGTWSFEPSIVTLGEHLDGARRLSRNGQTPYWCEDIAKDILG